jgi:hypothetical protein
MRTAITQRIGALIVAHSSRWNAWTERQSAPLLAVGGPFLKLFSKLHASLLRRGRERHMGPARRLQSGWRMQSRPFEIGEGHADEGVDPYPPQFFPSPPAVMGEIVNPRIATEVVRKFPDH